MAKSAFRPRFGAQNVAQTAATTKGVGVTDENAGRWRQQPKGARDYRRDGGERSGRWSGSLSGSGSGRGGRQGEEAVGDGGGGESVDVDDDVGGLLVEGRALRQEGLDPTSEGILVDGVDDRVPSRVHGGVYGRVYGRDGTKLSQSSGINASRDRSGGSGINASRGRGGGSGIVA